MVEPLKAASRGRLLIFANASDCLMYLIVDVSRYIAGLRPPGPTVRPFLLFVFPAGEDERERAMWERRGGCANHKFLDFTSVGGDWD